MTRYMILEDEGNGWSEHGQVEARSGMAAIRAIMDGTPNTTVGGRFAAIPLRSWKPVTVKVETKTALKFS